MGGQAASKANTHTEQDCGFRKRAESANAACLTNKDASSYFFILDSGATKDMVSDSNMLIDYSPFSSPRPVVLGNDTTIEALGQGTMVMQSTIDGQTVYCPFYNTLLVPKLGKGLISVPVLMRAHKTTSWDQDGVSVYSNGEQVLRANLLSNNVLQVTGKPITNTEEASKILSKLKLAYANTSTYASITDAKQYLLWHNRMGHPGKSSLIKTAKMVTGMELGSTTDTPICEPCIVANAKRAHHPTSLSKETSPGALLHMDHGILTIPTIHGETCYLLTMDDADHWTELHLQKTLTAAETLESFQRLERHMENQVARSVSSLKCIRSDEHGAFEGVFQQYLDQKGIVHQTSIRYEHENMGSIERMQRTIGEKHRAQMTFGKVPMELSGYSLEHATHVCNRTFTSTESKTPFERRTGDVPDVSHLKIFYSPAIVTIPKEIQNKTSAQHGIRCRYLGRCRNQPGDIFIEVTTHRIITSNAAVFLEEWQTNPTIQSSDYHISFDEPEDGTDKDYEPVTLKDMGTTLSELPVPRPARNTSKPREYWIAPTIFEEFDNSYSNSLDTFHAYVSTMTPHDQHVPRSLKEAQRHREWDHYKMAMSVELAAHHKNGTWKPTIDKSTSKPIRCKWVFAKKFNHDGSLNKYKARLVAMGNTQKHGIDYNETFAPTMALKSFRTLIALATAQGFPVYQADVPTAFIQGTLPVDEQIQMVPPDIPDDISVPPDFVHIPADHKALLVKSLYGLKQSPRVWYSTLKNALSSLGFITSTSDPCLFTWSTPGGQVTMGVYVDDLLYFGPPDMISTVLESLKTQFNISEMGRATWFLGIHIDQSTPGKITLDQSKYIKDFLQSLNLPFSRPISTPLDNHYPRLLSSAPDPTYTPPVSCSYNTIVGKLMYAMVGTRPDLCTAVGILSRYLQAPTNIHWEMALRVLQYLSGTINHGISFQSTGNISNDTSPLVWTDADYANDMAAKSISGYGMKLCNGPIIWYSKRQSTTAQSTAEAEYISANMCARTLVWLRQLLSCLGFPPTGPTTIYEDNQSCIAIAKNPQINEKTAHIQVKYHYIREKMDDDSIKLVYCKTDEQIADMFTKGLSSPLFTKFCKLFGLSDLGGDL